MNAKVYGFTHSPWVQAVLLALYAKEVDYDLYVSPPYEVFKKWGVYMPAVSLNEEPWEIESTQILTKLGYIPILVDELKAANNAWQGVLHRTDNPFRFFLNFARGGQISGSLMNDTVSNFLLSFVAFYMFMLINIGKWTLKQKEPDDFGNQFLYWENILYASKFPFIDGEKPGTRDFILFGVVQCHSSIPVPALDALLNDERLKNLRRWILTMQKRFQEYPYLYSIKYFGSDASQPNNAGIFQIGVFFVGLFIMFLLLPISIAAVLKLMSRVKDYRIKNF